MDQSWRESVAREIEQKIQRDPFSSYKAIRLDREEWKEIVRLLRAAEPQAGQEPATSQIDEGMAAVRRLYHDHEGNDLRVADVYERLERERPETLKRLHESERVVTPESWPHEIVRPTNACEASRQPVPGVYGETIAEVHRASEEQIRDWHEATGRVQAERDQRCPSCGAKNGKHRHGCKAGGEPTLSERIESIDIVVAGLVGRIEQQGARIENLEEARSLLTQRLAKLESAPSAVDVANLNSRMDVIVQRLNRLEQGHEKLRESVMQTIEALQGRLGDDQMARALSGAPDGRLR